ncbi:DegT/DnrJ/EryC1/StrS family aminotransferase [Arthrobacter sp. JSM 101049]|uniref:DegT/DnrJ/EryC1/StrS family aminotransferase n=1 Tax=Arthrobacter sp. JSM 101049 TaxID=929097 RepID=UPI0035694953
MDDTDTVPHFDLDLTQPDPIPASGIARAVELMESGRLFRYGETAPGTLGDAAQLEQRFAQMLGRKYAIAVNSCGAALFLALRSSGVRAGDQVLVNGYTLAPVPGAIDHAGATPVLVEVTENCTIDTTDLERRASESGAKALLLSHMRGHVSNMDEVVRVCNRYGITLIEDCAHTLGASWDGRASGTFGTAACFSLQTFKHINAGEGGIIVTDDDELAVRAILNSGSYMLYGQHAARPSEEAFEPLRGKVPNYSLRLSATAAAVALPQLDLLEERGKRMNASYQLLETLLKDVEGLRIMQRDPREGYIGSSFQFCLPEMEAADIGNFLATCLEHGLGIKWFGQERMEGFTSRPSQWEYVDERMLLSQTEALLSTLCDMRIPPAMTEHHCHQAAHIITHAIQSVRSATG